MSTGTYTTSDSNSEDVLTEAILTVIKLKLSKLNPLRNSKFIKQFRSKGATPFKLRVLAVVMMVTIFLFSFGTIVGLSLQVRTLDKLLRNHLEIGQVQVNPAVSCAALLPASPSGNYWIRDSNGSAVNVYCEMTRVCDGVTRGWTRVTKLSMENNKDECPSGFIRRTDTSSTHTCVRNNTAAGCAPIKIPTRNINYFAVCGKIIAYQVGMPNQFRPEEGISRPTDINGEYLDGVSLTHGTKREHIWSFAAATHENQTCLCNNNVGDSPPKFVGPDYFCEAGSVLEAAAFEGILLPTDPLWDGNGCMSWNTCCSFNGPPWFYKELSQPTTDDIELRVCKDSCNLIEDVAIKTVEIYIQ